MGAAEGVCKRLRRLAGDAAAVFGGLVCGENKAGKWLIREFSAKVGAQFVPRDVIHQPDQANHGRRIRAAAQRDHITARTAFPQVIKQAKRDGPGEFIMFVVQRWNHRRIAARGDIRPSEIRVNQARVATCGEDRAVAGAA